MNPLKAALDSKLGRKLRGISVVDNVKNLNSAYNKRLPFSGSRFDPDDVVKVRK